MKQGGLLIFMLGLFSCLASISNADEISRDHVLATFKEYEALNIDFVLSVSEGKGKSGKSYSELRKEVEAFSAGSFHASLNQAKNQVCDLKDVEILKALFQVVVATSNSANEASSTTLGQVYICQPDLVIKTLDSSSPNNKKELFGLLEFGFENAVYQKQGDQASSLRQRLQSIKPN